MLAVMGVVTRSLPCFPSRRIIWRKLSPHLPQRCGSTYGLICNRLTHGVCSMFLSPACSWSTVAVASPCAGSQVRLRNLEARLGGGDEDPPALLAPASAGPPSLKIVYHPAPRNPDTGND